MPDWAVEVNTPPYSCDDRIRWDVSCHYRTRRNNTAFADGHAWKHDGVAADPHVIRNRNRLDFCFGRGAILETRLRI